MRCFFVEMFALQIKNHTFGISLLAWDEVKCKVLLTHYWRLKSSTGQKTLHTCLCSTPGHWYLTTAFNIIRLVPLNPHKCVYLNVISWTYAYKKLRIFHKSMPYCDQTYFSWFLAFQFEAFKLIFVYLLQIIL